MASGLNDSQVRLLEILASSALNIASIFFAVLTVLFGSLLAVRGEAERRPLRVGIGVTYAFVIASLALTATALISARYGHTGWYAATIGLVVITMLGVFVVATLLVNHTFGFIKKKGS